MANFLDKEAWVPMATADVGTATANNPVVVTYAADTAQNGRWLISGLSVSYSGTPTGGNVQISDGTNVFFNQDILVSGPTIYNWKIPKSGAPGAALVITLAAGGSGVVGLVSATVWQQRQFPQ